MTSSFYPEGGGSNRGGGSNGGEGSNRGLISRSNRESNVELIYYQYKMTQYNSLNVKL